MRDKPLPRDQILLYCVLGFFLAILVFVYLKDHPSNFRGFEVKNTALTPILAQDNFQNFATWKKQANFQSLFNFYLPDSVEVKTIEANKKFQVDSAGKSGQTLISIEQLTYPDFQKNKLSMDTQGEKQFGWTNAYGASVFEYKKDVLTAFVVDKEKKEVLKLVTPDEKNFGLLENVVRTFQTVQKETDLHGPWYVNFMGEYKIRYASDLELQTENPFVESVQWKVKFKDPKKEGTITMNVHANQGGEDEVAPPTLQELKVDGVVATMYQNDDKSSSIAWAKNGRFFTLISTADSPQTDQTLKNLMLQMIASFRFLTDQEKMQ